MIFFIVILLAFYLAWNLGANDVANSMGTSVGSKAVTLRQALVIAGVLEFTGAVLFGGKVSQTIATEIANPSLFAKQPEVLLIGMVSVLLACGLWLQIATSFGFPVSSSHATVGAIAGFSLIAAGMSAVDWSSLGLITMGWILSPFVSGAIAALFYSTIKRWILDQPDPLAQLQEWIPWLSSALLGIFGVIVLPTATQPLESFFRNHWGVNLPAYDFPLFTGALATVSLSLITWRQLDNRITREQKSQPTEPLPINNLVEKQLAKFQVLSACFVAFAHGSNDVGNAIAPLATIVYIQRTGSVPLADFSIPLWILVLGGIGIVAGLAVWGKNVITTVGEKIIPLKPSGGFCAELATATTVLVASRFGLPVSTSQALVGGVVGIGLVQNWRSIRLSTLRGIASAWLITVPMTAALAAIIFVLVRLLLSQL